MIKLLDFGLSKAASEQSASDLGIGMAMDSYDLGEHLTCTGDMLGTPDFIAPEQIADSQQADIRADIYSLGCTLYYLLSGQAPFPNLTLREVLKAHRSLYARPLDHVRAEVPANLSAVVTRMMAKDPADRFQEPAEVADALTAFFKKGELGQGVRPDMPQEFDAIGGRSGVHSRHSGDVLGSGNRVRQARKSATAPLRATPPVATLVGLIDLAETDNGSEKRLESPAGKRIRPGPWGLSVVAGIFLLSLLFAWAAVPTTRQKNAPPPAIDSRKQVSERHSTAPKASILAPPGAPPKEAIVSSPIPIARWTFESDTRDEIGAVHGTLFGGAILHGGRLYLDGKTGYMKTEPLSRDIREKTLEAWVIAFKSFSARWGR